MKIMSIACVILHSVRMNSNEACTALQSIHCALPFSVVRLIAHVIRNNFYLCVICTGEYGF